MDHRDEWFAPESVEEQIERSQQASINSQMMHDLQAIAESDVQRLAIIKERLMEYASGNIQRKPVSLQRYQITDAQPQFQLGRQRARQHSQFLVKLLSGVAAVLVIASMLLVFALFKPQQEQGHVNLKTPVVISTLISQPVIQGKAAFLLDTTSGKVLVDINGHIHQPMGSLAQIMTAVVAIDNADLNQSVTIEQATLNEVPLGASTAQLVGGDQIPLRDLLSALLLPSGNDAALVIAHAVGGSTQSFVTMMNDEAQQLQLYDTHFSSPYGSSAPDEYSSAADLTRLAQYAMQLSEFGQVVAGSKHGFAATSQSYLWHNTNTLSFAYTGMTVIKTGDTVQSGANIVFSLQRNDHLLIGTESGASSKNILAVDIKKLLG